MLTRYLVAKSSPCGDFTVGHIGQEKNDLGNNTKSKQYNSTNTVQIA